MFLFILAYESSYLYDARNKSTHYSHYMDEQPQYFMVNVSDVPVVSKEYVKLSVKLHCIEYKDQWHYAEGNTIVYLKNSPELKADIGSKLLLHTKFNYLSQPKNPYEFDYKSFLESKNIFHTVFAKQNDVQIDSSSTDFDITEIGSTIKSKLVSVLRNSHLSQRAFSICSALLVGYDDEIDDEVMQSFSHLGTLHILSVSGMHTAVLYGILIYIFSLVDKYDQFKKTKFVFVMFFLLLFVFVTGLSPSVLRAALMLSLIMLGKTFYKQGNSYNTLFLSAFLLLLFNPYLIKDIGFLLSYMAVFGIMYLYPLLSKLYRFDNKYIQNSWSGVLMSVSATVFTLPVSLYCFHQFPIWFVFSNLVIIPLSMLIMGAAALFLLLWKISFVNQILVYVINGLTDLMIWIAGLTDNPNYGFVNDIPFLKSDVLFLSLVIALCLIVIYNKQYKYVVTLCVTLTIWLSVSIYVNYESSTKKELLVFHVKQKSAYLLRVGQHVYANFSDISDEELQRHVKPYLLTISGLKIIRTNGNLLKQESIGILNLNEKHIQFSAFNPNYIIVSNDTPVEITTNHKIKPVIIADCSNSPKFVRNLKKTCALLDVPLYSVKEKGALQIQL